METGLLFMTKKTINTTIDTASKEDFKKLSIQVSLNGLSFCVFDTIQHQVLKSGKRNFKSESTPYLILKELKKLFDEEGITEQNFNEVVVVHRNNLFGLVPKDLFDENELANYLKFNTKLLANDHIVFDEIKNFDMFNVYVPFTNVNNYIFSLFGEFEFKHSGTVLLQILLGLDTLPSTKVCYAYISQNNIEVVVLGQRKPLLYNYFSYKTKEDFLYYLLFIYEQLELDTSEVELKLFGSVEENDELYEMAYQYIKNIAVFTPSNASHILDSDDIGSIDLTVLSAQ
ncbi:MAG: DUF3822 family protein [Allomuricauda sp.]|nr:MAG: DUF3822 family protein [Allomuricauda sp.]